MRTENKELLDYKAIGRRIKDCRTRAGLTQKQLAALANIEYSALGNLERGTKRIGLTSLVLIAKVFGESVDYLLFGELGNLRGLNEDEKEWLESLNGFSEKQRKAIIRANKILADGLLNNR